MSCPGLHCPGCSEGQSFGILGGAIGALILADRTVQFVAERIWWIGGTMALSFAAAVGVSMALEVWSDRRGARYAAAHGIVSRADVILREPACRGVFEPAPECRELAAPAIHLHFHGLPSDEQAAIIRQALPGDAIIEED